MKQIAALIVISILAALAVTTASASEIVDRNATGVSLKVNSKGEALVEYTTAGARKHVLVWGAINALDPTPSSQQVSFQKDYTGGWGKYYTADPEIKKLQAQFKALKAKGGKGYLSSPVVKQLSEKANYAKNYYSAGFNGSCKPYTGPKLAWFVVACTAPDGSYWALQSWQRALPNLGETPWKTEQSVWELHLSHWNTDLPALEVHPDWVYSKHFHHVFGRYTYLGKPIFGYKSTASGNPLDTFGRNVYLDTFDSAYGSGWLRENSFLAHTNTGVFCYGFYTHPPYPGYPAGDRPEGKGSQYRLTAIGPGVTPDVMSTWNDTGEYDALDPAKVALETAANVLEKGWNDTQCQQG
jgi:hypothetical protein